MVPACGLHLSILDHTLVSNCARSMSLRNLSSRYGSKRQVMALPTGGGGCRKGQYAQLRNSRWQSQLGRCQRLSAKSEALLPRVWGPVGARQRSFAKGGCDGVSGGPDWILEKALRRRAHQQAGRPDLAGLAACFYHLPRTVPHRCEASSQTELVARIPLGSRAACLRKCVALRRTSPGAI